MASVREVFVSIAHCPNIALALKDTSHPCSAIVRSQHVVEKEFQLPEPWRGQIDKARILFVGSNPSIGDDRYALRSTPDELVWESQHLAFGGGSRPYILDGIKTTKPDGSPLKVVRYWTSVRAWARELLADAIPGEDYAVTEIVHCKSVDEIGVHEAALTCYNLHASNVFSVSPAKVVVVLGKFAREALLGAERTCRACRWTSSLVAEPGRFSFCRTQTPEAMRNRWRPTTAARPWKESDGFSGRHNATASTSGTARPRQNSSA